MSINVIIKEAQPAQCSEAYTVAQAAFAKYRGQLQPESSAERETFDGFTAKRETHTLLIAQLDPPGEGKIVGCVFYIPLETNIYFHRLAVLPEYQNKGIARKLITAVESAAKHNGYSQVTLGVRIALEDNWRYFQSLGYREISRGTHDGFSEPTYLTMAKNV